MAVITITIEGVPPYDGTHPIDFDEPLNGKELHLIKEASGLRMGEISEGLEAGDYDLIVAMAVIALIRGGKVEMKRAQLAVEVLLEADMGKITATAETEEEEESPLAQPNAPETQSGNEGSSTSSSEDSSTIGDAPRVTSLPRTGTPV